MKIEPSLFPLAPSLPRPSSSPNASEARRAFEAMLSASSAKSRSVQATSSGAQDDMPTNLVRAPEHVQSDVAPNAEMAPMSRPGRVLDIKV